MKRKIEFKICYRLLGKLLCFIGWHKWTCSLQDCIDEFGFVRNDGRMPKVAKCKRCKNNYG